MLIDCPLCKVDTQFLFETKDCNRKLSNEIFFYYRCPKCKLVFLPQIPENLGDFYDDYHKPLPLEQLAQIGRREKFKIDTVKRFITKGKLLEIGPSIGAFVFQAKQAGFEVDAIEMSRECCEYLTNDIGINAVNSDSPHDAVKALGPHDAIALWNSIEHLPDPWACLNQVAKKLTSGGVLIIAAPNPNSFGFRILGSKWPHVDAPRHLNLIPLQVLVDYLKPLGLEPVMTTTNDQGARYNNRFCWQIYLMERFSVDERSILKQSKWKWLFWAIIGYAVSLPLALIERRHLNGSAYTVVFQKTRFV
jgi:hypothetical protein